MIRQARTPTARPTDFDLNKLQRKLAIAVGRHDWPPGVEVALRRAFASGRYGCMGSDVIEDSKLMFLLKEEFGVGSMLGNHELSALIASYPHPHGAVEIEWFIDNLLAQRHVMRKVCTAVQPPLRLWGKGGPNFFWNLFGILELRTLESARMGRLVRPPPADSFSSP